MRYTIGTLLFATSVAGVLCAFAPALVILMCSAVPLLLFVAMCLRHRRRLVDFGVGMVLLLPIYFFSEGLTELPRTYYLNNVSTPGEIATYNSWLETRDTLYWPYWTWVRADAARAAQLSPAMRANAFSGFSSFLLWYHDEWGRYAEIAVFGKSTSDALVEDTAE